jgi:hypothetical protein
LRCVLFRSRTALAEFQPAVDLASGLYMRSVGCR